jgi:hypothetical protein
MVAGARLQIGIAGISTAELPQLSDWHLAATDENLGLKLIKIR